MKGSGWLVVISVFALAAAACSSRAPASPALSPSATGAPAAATQFDPTRVIVRLDMVASGFTAPVFVTNAGDGSGRLFVVERGGVIRVVTGGAVAPGPFLDITPLVVSGGERGLLGLAFDPGYARNGRFFVAYTAAPDGANTVARYRVSSDPARADAASATTLLSVPDPAPNHNGGMLAFGPDGYLYVGMGDGGSGQSANAQRLDTLLGKLLRLDPSGGEPYVVPPSNPFAGRADARPEIWAYGLRNPWRFSFDRATGDLWIGDVGAAAWEEIDYQPAGKPGGQNYGWDIMEGAACRSERGCDTTGLTAPVATYDHQQGCSVSGGYVYRGQADPGLAGAYLYGDYCSGVIWSLSRAAGGAWASTKLLESGLSISSFGEDEAGELYLTDLRGGVYRVRG